MRHTPFFDEIVNRRHLIERLMSYPGKVKDHIFSKTLMEEGLGMDNIQMVIYKLFLKRSVVAVKANFSFA